MSRSDREAHKAQLVAELSDGLDELYASGAVTTRDEPVAVAGRMVASVPRRHVYDDSVGPFYDTDGVRKVLSRNGTPVSRQAVFDRIRRRTILASKTADGHWAYPAFQFTGGEVDPALRRILARFRDTDSDGWAVAAWLNAPSPALDELSPMQWLREDRPVGSVNELAQETAARWSAP
ncbi:hypothetical protein ACLQ14_01090 [Luteimicrobium sp. DT211]